MTINNFSGTHGWLSNFWPSPVRLRMVQFPTVEHAFQAAKVAPPTDWITRAMAPAQGMALEQAQEDAWLEAVAPFQTGTAGQAKRRGRQVELRPDWEKVKVDVMRKLLRQKFDNIDLRVALLNTRPHHLIEGNHWGDTFWGVCDGNGENMLGTLLMEIRREIA